MLVPKIGSALKGRQDNRKRDAMNLTIIYLQSSLQAYERYYL